MNVSMDLQQGVRATGQGQGQSDRQIQQLDKQIAKLQDEMRKVRRNDELDSETKKSKIEEYQKQIDLLNQQKAQIQANEQRSRAERAKEKSGETEAQSPKENRDVVELSTQQAFIGVSAAQQVNQDLGAVRTRLEGDLRIAESNSYLREGDPAAAAEVRGKLAFIDNTVAGRIGEAREKLAVADDERQTTAAEEAREEEEKQIAEDGEYLDTYA